MRPRWPIAAVLAGSVAVAGCGTDDPGDGPAAWVDATTAGVHVIATEPHPLNATADGRGMVEGLALAGDAALLARESPDATTVERLALRDGAALTVLRAGGGLRVLSLDASPSIAGLTVTDADDEEGGPRSGLYVGPPSGPLRLRVPIRDEGWIPRSVRADGDRVQVREIRGRNESEERTVVFDAAGRPPGGRVIWPPDMRGSLADVSPSGARVLQDTRGGVVEVREGRRRRLQFNDRPPPWPGRSPAYAGERVLLTSLDRAFGPEQLLLAAPEGRPRAFGVPSGSLGYVNTDARRVIWSANGCVLVATVTTPAATAPPAGRCPRTEIALDTDQNPDRIRLDAGNRVRVRIECVAAPAPGCRGTMRLTGRPGAAMPQRFVIAPGRVRRLAIGFRPRVAATIRSRGNGANYSVSVVARDPGGRKTQWRDAVQLLGNSAP